MQMLLMLLQQPVASVARQLQQAPANQRCLWNARAEGSYHRNLGRQSRPAMQTPLL
jgi:hypothetical protein